MSDYDPARDYDPIPTGPVSKELRGVLPTEGQAIELRNALLAAGLELGEVDERVVKWLAGWEWYVVATIASWAGRAAAGGDVTTGAKQD